MGEWSCAPQKLPLILPLPAKGRLVWGVWEHGVGLRVVAVVGERGGILDSAQCITQVNRPRLLRLGAQTAMLLWLPGLVVLWRVTQTSECGPRALPEHAALSWPLGMAQTKEEKHPVLTLRGPHSGERNNLAFTVWPARGWSPTYITFT